MFKLSSQALMINEAILLYNLAHSVVFYVLKEQRLRKPSKNISLLLIAYERNVNLVI